MLKKILLAILIYYSPFVYSQVVSGISNIYHDKRNPFYRIANLAVINSVSVAIIDASPEVELRTEELLAKIERDITAFSESHDKTKRFHNAVMPYIYLRLLEAMEKATGQDILKDIKLSVYTAENFDQFKVAVDRAISEQVDLIVHPNVWETMGFTTDINGDDGDDTNDSYLRPYVNKAIDAGIVWLNAAGNFQGLMYKDRVYPMTAAKDKVWLPGPNHSLQVRCDMRILGQGESYESHSDRKCNVKVTLVWNSFKVSVDAEPIAINKDLDLVVYDDAMNVVKYSKLRQVGEERKKALKHSKQVAWPFPSEKVQFELKPGQSHRLVIKVHSNNFTKEDWFRISISGDYVEMVEKPIKKIKRMISPADHPRVIVFGDRQSYLSSRNDFHEKPDFMFNSQFFLQRSKEIYPFGGSSNAVMLGAVVVSKIMMASESLMHWKQIKQTMNCIYKDGLHPKKCIAENQ